MLVLSRKTDEAIQIGDDIRIVILDIDSDRIRIGIDAPRSMRIYREELLQETADLNKEASSAPAALDVGSILAAKKAKKPAEEKE